MNAILQNAAGTAIPDPASPPGPDLIFVLLVIIRGFDHGRQDGF
jgi:hypothetical protein